MRRREVVTATAARGATHAMSTTVPLTSFWRGVRGRVCGGCTVLVEMLRAWHVGMDVGDAKGTTIAAVATKRTIAFILAQFIVEVLIFRYKRGRATAGAAAGLVDGFFDDKVDVSARLSFHGWSVALGLTTPSTSLWPAARASFARVT
jgi:hypothetical protein